MRDEDIEYEAGRTWSTPEEVDVVAATRQEVRGFSSAAVLFAVLALILLLGSAVASTTPGEAFLVGVGLSSLLVSVCCWLLRGAAARALREQEADRG